MDCKSKFWLLGASRDQFSLDPRDVGVVTLNECAAIYSGGRFGEISELYVVPDYRSKGVGAMLMEAAVALGREWLAQH